MGKGARLTDPELKKLAVGQNLKAAAYLAEEKRLLGPKFKAADASCAKASSYDLRKVGLSSPVRDQDVPHSCDSCYDHAAIAALESSWKMINGQSIGASEQQIMNCAVTAGSCSLGGAPSSVMVYLQFAAIPSRADVPYTGTTGGCNDEKERRYSVGTWGFAAAVTPEVADIKAALCEHGALASPMYAGTASFHSYPFVPGSTTQHAWPDDVFNARDTPLVTSHVVTIIGWDDSKHAWLIKNSWGTGWGITANDPSPTPTAGYAWMNYQSNDIGRGAVWAHARRACPGDGEYDAGLCYAKCKPGYHGLGPMCWENCGPGLIDDGATCRAPISTITKKTTTRGAGTPMGCSPNEQQGGALCYPKCPAGYKDVGPVCWEICKPGYTDDGVFCSKPLEITGANTSKCPWYDVCGLTLSKGCSTCPAGTIDDGCTCRVNGESYLKKTVGLGVGTVLHTCPAGHERSGALCYPDCAAGYHGVGPVCWENCPAGYSDDGVFCGKGGQVTVSKSYGRGVGKPPP